MKKRFRQIIYACLLILVLVVGFTYLEYSNRQKEQRDAQLTTKLEETRKEAEQAASITINDNSNLIQDSKFISVVDVINNNAEGEILVTPKQFADNARLSSAYLAGNDATAILDISDTSLNPEDILVLQFTAYTLEAPVTLKVKCGDISNTVFISKTSNTYYVPLSGLSELNSIQFRIISDFANTVIDSVYLVNYGNGYDIKALKTGAYAVDKRERIDLEKDTAVIGNSTQCLIKDDLLFSLYNGELTAYRVSVNKEYEQLSSIEELGQTTRDMVFSEDESAILITSRQNGMYIVDISDPYNMRKISHYDTLEAATGLSVNGHYAFLCSRYFGIEVVDVSDLSKPTFVNRIGNDTEYQDCYVDGKYLYVGVYQQKYIDIYNVEDLGNPIKVSSIELDGSGQGCYVSENILYVATGLNSANDSTYLWSYGKGTGNGMEVYDVSEPSKPIHLSTVKTDGRMSINTSDVWDVQVSGNYAYLTNMYNGLYIYDVSDPANPICKYEYRLILNNKDEEYVHFDDVRYIFPWTAEKEGRGCVYHVVIDDKRIYIVMPNSGVYVVDSEIAAKPAQANTYSNYIISEHKKELPKVNGYKSELYKISDSIWAVTVKNNKIYAACGEAGVHILNEDMRLIDKIETDYSVRDVKIFDNFLFTAESEGGIGVYSIENGIKKVATAMVDPNYYCATQLEVSNDGKYIIAQVSPNKHLAYDVSDPFNPMRISINDMDTGSMYYRNICTGVVDNKYIGIFGSAGICWYYSDGSTLVELDTMANTFYEESGGMTAAKDKCIAITQNGYKYFDVANGKTSELFKIENFGLQGKCSSNGNLMVVSTSYNGKVIILDISDIDAPIVISRFNVDGNPDIAFVTDNTILIPCRYGGLLKLERCN